MRERNLYVCVRVCVGVCGYVWVCGCICRFSSLAEMRCGVYRGALQNIIANVGLFQKNFYVLITQSVLLL